jgi:hypothetical protein
MLILFITSLTYSITIKNNLIIFGRFLLVGGVFLLILPVEGGYCKNLVDKNIAATKVTSNRFRKSFVIADSE